MSKAIYYDGTKLLSLMDIDGKRPEIYICTSNRSAGKTVFFSRLLVNRWLKKKQKFALLYRYNYELDNCADKFFKDINNLFFPNMTMTSKRKCKGMYHELYLDDANCGYAIALNNADTIKKYSHLFSDVENILFDEFQSETNNYTDREVEKFISIHTSIARGNGLQSRYVPVFMVSNPVSLLNPYYTALKISSRLTEQMNFLRGKGWVVEQGFNESASTAQKESSFMQAFSYNEYVNYNNDAVYLNDNKAFIDKPNGTSKYICTLKYEGKTFGIREYTEEGIIFCDNKADETHPRKISLTTDDHDINYLMLRRNDILLMRLRYFFEHGCVRFKDLECKDAFLTALSY